MPLAREHLAKVGVAQQSKFLLSFLWQEKKSGALPHKVMRALTRKKSSFFCMALYAPSFFAYLHLTQKQPLGSFQDKTLTPAYSKNV